MNRISHSNEALYKVSDERHFLKLEKSHNRSAKRL